ncbi:Epoxide hydrolase [Candidatus Burkholderia verschuerenii]|uniref:Epoxide hydrolase n=2 Tax=Candidatus Burkholderia verschuerenii TaxID=242163 RepID=A0A0L0MGV0_9BURK|nr:Epoxide hydrolase [Candidatus Burkholderia verschuerenii]
MLGGGSALATLSLLSHSTLSKASDDSRIVGSQQTSSIASFDSIRQIEAGELNVGYVDEGPRDSPVVMLLHGWPHDIYSFYDVTRILVASGHRVIVPYLRGYGTTRIVSADTIRNGQQSVFAADIIALMDALNIEKAILAGFDWGGRAANIVAALWPERCRALVSVSGYLIGSQEANRTPSLPQAELQAWFQYYFATERGVKGYAANREEFNKLIWRNASPKFRFDDATYARTAQAFDNPDHVAIVIHNYRWRLGLAQGESRYDALEKRLAQAPKIAVATITLEGDANGAPHQAAQAYATQFIGKYQHREVTGGIGHNLPQEAPKAFADAVMDVVEL